MKALFLTEQVGLSGLMLRETAIPKVGDNQLLVKVDCIGLNYADLLVCKGVYPASGDFPSVLSGEVEGTVVQSGNGAQHIKPGQRITGVASQGFAEFAVLNASDSFLLPASQPSGMGLLVQGITAMHLLSQVQNKGSIIITAAAGGVGSFLVQLAALNGFEQIIAMVGRAEKADYVKSLGATHVVSYNEESWPFTLGHIIHPFGANVIVDAIGGDLGSTLVAHLGYGGVMLVYGSTSGTPTSVNAQDLIFKANKVIGSTIYAANPNDKQRWFDQLCNRLLSNSIRHRVTEYPFSNFMEAFQSMQSRASSGKIVLRP